LDATIFEFVNSRIGDGTAQSAFVKNRAAKPARFLVRCDGGAVAAGMATP